LSTSGHRLSRAGVVGAWSEQIDRLFALLDRPCHPGGMVAVVRAGEVVHRRGYGVADIEHDVPFSASTILRLGSTSKHLTCAAVLRLEDRGLLDLDDDVHDYLPELPDWGEDVRLRHLTTMTSGLADGLTRVLFGGVSTAHPLRRAEVFDLACRQPQLLFAPGEHCSYSNTNYNLISLVIERVSGQSLRRFLRSELFEPLGLASADLVPDQREVVPGLASGYQPFDEDEGIERPPDLAEGAAMRGSFAYELCGDGGINMSIHDLVRWLGHYRTGIEIGPRFRERMESEAMLRDGTPTGYALGLSIDSFHGWRKVSHAGGMPGYLCDFALYESPSGKPGDDLGVVQLWNWMDPRLLESADRIAAMVLADELEVSRSSAATGDAARERRERPAWAVGLYACLETGELLELVTTDGELLCFYLGEASHLEPSDDGRLWRAAKRGLLYEIESLGANSATSPGQRPKLAVRFGAQSPRHFEPIAVPAAAPQAARLDEYAGIYRSDELAEEVVLSPTDGELEIALRSPLRSLLWNRLRPLAGDLFCAVFETEPSLTNISALFRRDAEGRTIELHMATSRAGTVVFERVPGTKRQ
jgi:CubicO group peptidase (beta-lactamase class C family)